jgi:hypothetical protein
LLDAHEQVVVVKEDEQLVAQVDYLCNLVVAQDIVNINL